MENIKHKILLILLTLTIVGEIVGIFIWVFNPASGGYDNSRFTLAVDYTIAVLNHTIMVGLNLIAFYGISKKLISTKYRIAFGGKLCSKR